ncbi:phosphatase PAP2 family protein [Bauldia sp.]|uniref:phosphatase PAP2 family protein n=1 Tax=Bauldia sp. TaxID=2575872 RepID=UPI003BABC229
MKDDLGNRVRSWIATGYAAVAAYPIVASLVAVAITSAFFLAFPGVDTWISHLFHRDEDGFFLRRNDALQWLRNFGYFSGIAIVAWLVFQLVLKLVHPQQQSYVPPNVTLFLLSTLIAGPLLLVNAVLKNNWGRPRPRAVDVFGGDSPYVEVWRISDYCDTNCSFVSGEASSAFWLVAVALVLPKPVRYPATVAAVVFATLLSLNRIAFGGHFTSDVVISIALTLLLIAIGYRLFISRPPTWLSGDRLEASLTRIGYWLHRRKPPRSSTP